MTITINRRKLLVAGLAVAIIAAACYIAFLVGQTTRITEATATTRTATAVTAAVKRADGKHVAAMKAAKAAAHKHERKRVAYVYAKWRKRVKQLKRQNAAAVTAARNAGYASGSSAGFSSGHAAGRDEGYGEGAHDATDEVVCSDDLDVTWLPYCGDY